MEICLEINKSQVRLSHNIIYRFLKTKEFIIMKIAVEGCAHGELDNIYDTIKYLEEKEGLRIDLLICCGDFQSTRNEADLKCMAVPQKYSSICSFYRYYSGEKEAPVLTIFIGGNHEASNYLQELPYGGWVAPNIFYIGYAGVINVAGIRIGGLSGIFKSNDYKKGHFEKSPYNDRSKRSVYHIRNLEIFRLKQLSKKLDIFLSHDWPSGISEYGNKAQLLKFKPFLKEDIESGKLGSKPCEELLHCLKPNYWFAAHLHCKFAALVPHDNKNVTKFLALDKCLPKRRFLQIVNLAHDENREIKISYDLEWLAILHLTNHLTSVKDINIHMPGPAGNERWEFQPSEEEKLHILNRFDSILTVPKNFVKTVDPYNPDTPRQKDIKQPSAKLNPQTITFCQKLGVDDPILLLAELNGTALTFNNDESFEHFGDLDSFKNDSSTSTPAKRLTGLHLPEPKLETSMENYFREVENLSILSKESSDSSQDLSENMVNSIEKYKNNDTPLRKKFRRRNAEIYENDVGE